jgi:hypothetical protein
MADESFQASAKAALKVNFSATLSAAFDFFWKFEASIAG